MPETTPQPAAIAPDDTPSVGVERATDSMLAQIHQGDCIEGMRRLADASIDLVFADPPFNIGYRYDVYEDRLESEQYLNWSREWISEVHRVLRQSGSFWLAIGDEYAAELKLAAQAVGFRCRNWVVWYYTFGVHCKYKFTRSHAHLFHFVKHPDRVKFNSDTVRVPSARQLVYADARANSAGRMPDDTWILRPQDLVDGFTPGEDVWYFPRVAGTFKERAGFHGCQMPEQLLGRIIRSCSDEGDVVMDPFSGSSTTAATAKKLGRRWLSFELSEDYVRLGRIRLEGIRPGDPLDGSAEPKVSAPSTSNGKPISGDRARAASRAAKGATVHLPKRDPAFGFSQGRFDFDALSEGATSDAIIEAFSRSCDGHSVDRVLADPVLHDDFQQHCDRGGIGATPAERNRMLFRLRAAGGLKAAGIHTEKRTQFTWTEQSAYRFAAQIAWRMLADEHPGRTLDELLCDPRLAEQFDTLAMRYRPGFRPLEYRWAALTLRRNLRRLRQTPECESTAVVEPPSPESLAEGIPMSEISKHFDSLPAAPGVLLIGRRTAEDSIDMQFVDEAADLACRAAQMFEDAAVRRLWTAAGTTTLWHLPLADTDDGRLRYQAGWLKRYPSRWNAAHFDEPAVRSG